VYALSPCGEDAGCRARRASACAPRRGRQEPSISVAARAVGIEVRELKIMALSVVIVLLVVGSLLFHFLSPWYFTPLASNWDMIDTTVDITFWVTGIVFVAVNLFMAYCVWKFRHR
jgi:hypothetical protein